MNMASPVAAEAMHGARTTFPYATLRLQFHQGFGFDDALARIDYYAALGVSHLYASPIFTARSGSTHGYDVVDPTRVNPELGGEEGLRRLTQALHQRRMGLIVDIVPNHMAIGEQNPWWRDVLLWGRHSAYAHWFDIDWLPGDAALHGKVLLPVLGKSYGEVLRDGEISLRFDVRTARLEIVCPGHCLPVAPEDYVDVLATSGADGLTPVIDAFRRIQEAAVQEERQACAVSAWQALSALAADADGLADIDAALTAFSGSVPHGMQGLHELLERQHYRLCDWRNAGDEINWRRFFEIGDLIGMRVEQDEVFEATHALLFRLYEEGLIDGVRIDHIDGLADPAAYARRLRARLQSLRNDRAGPPCIPYIIAEKILAADESLPGDWGLDGTTGYDFMDQVGGVLHDPAGEQVLDAIWREYAAERGNFDALVQAARRRLLERNFASEFNALTYALHALARSVVDTRDISLMAIRRCLLELLTYFPVYRTYRTCGTCRAPCDRDDSGGHRNHDSRDAFVIRSTAALVRERLREPDHAALNAVAGWLADPLTPVQDERHVQLHWRALTRFQQLTPPLTAKSTEDTAFYRYGRLLSRNEVGADPGRLALSVDDFHKHARRRQRDFPFGMLATATHDHKRGEDARARLAVLSEIPQRWQQVLQHWRTLNNVARMQVPIDAVDELMLYQTLIGVWPLTPLACDSEEFSALQERVCAWQRKALREAKRRSDWNAPDLIYEGHCEDFLRRILSKDAGNAFVPALAAFVSEIAAAGALNSLSQTMLRLSAPGIPDLYQGCDLWDFSLVDPDNRRPVDYDLRQRLMTQEQSGALTLDDWRSGACKQQLIRAMLHFRSSRAGLFTVGDYIPLTVEGALAEHLVAFARTMGELTVIVLCSRHAAGLVAGTGPQAAMPLIPAQRWGNTAIQLPLPWAVGEWQSVLCGAQGAIRGQRIMAADALGSFPVDLLLLSQGLQFLQENASPAYPD